MMRLKAVLFVGCVSAVSTLTGCAWIEENTGAGETTTVAAATGGVLGAGLGAIVGNQTGDAGTGLVIGALAGTAAGAAVGSVLEGQEQVIQTQDEAIERQEKMIRAQSEELSELRRGSLDSASLGNSTSRTYPGAGGATSDPYGRGAPVEARIPPPMGQSGSIREQEIARYPANYGAASSIAGNNTLERSDVNAARAPGRTSSSWADSIEDSAVSARLDRAESEVAGSRSIAGSDMNQQVSGDGATGKVVASASECSQAEDEYRKALRGSEPSEQLFHLRRALRLCPERSDFHNSLGEVYVQLNRGSDAAYEFGEALRIDPSNEKARANLRMAQEDSLARSSSAVADSGVPTEGAFDRY